MKLPPLIPYSSDLTSESWIHLIKFLLSERQYKYVITVTDLYLRFYPESDYVLHYFRGVAFYNLKQYDAALYFFDKSERKSYNYKGLALLRLRRYEEAIEQFAKLHQSNIRNYNLACCYYQLGNINNCLAHITLAIRADPELKSKIRDDSDFILLKDNPKFIKLLED